jgi:hypothetical protein
MATEYAAPPVPARLDRHEQARQDRLVRAEIEREREAARVQVRIAEREAAARVKLEAAAARRAAKAAARDDRAARLGRLAGWVSAHVVDLLFVPVIGVPALLSWTAMAAFGMLLYGLPGVALPAFSEGAMWAFAAAVTITVRRYPGRPVWHLRAGIAVFAVFGAALNYVHGSSMTPVPGLPHGPVTGAVMAAVSVAGVIAHQLITAGPRGKHRDDETALTVDEPDTAPATAADRTPATVADTGPDSTPDAPAAAGTDTAPAPGRAAARTRRGPSTAARVAAMRDRHPDMSTAEIARRLKLSDRTVRRYLPAASPGEPEAVAA